jgi:hypothetical protein
MRLSVFMAATLSVLLPATLSRAEPNAPARGVVSAPSVVTAPSVSIEPGLSARLAAMAPGADPAVIELAVRARECAIRSGDATGQGQRLAVIDYSMPSTAKRMWVFDVANPRLLYAEHVAHGQGSGANFAREFSNREGSHQTSLGLFRTAETYMGGNGYSLRMDGLDPGFNDAARQRAIVMHGAPYVNPAAAQQTGRLGRSHGCPAVRSQVAREIIDTLKGGQFVFSYYPDPGFLRSARMLACNTGSGQQLASR